MPVSLIQKDVGPWPMSTYLIACEETKHSAIVDPGADPDKILALAGGTEIKLILITHGHFDHVSALEELKSMTGVPVYLHPADGEKFDLSYDHALSDGDVICLGKVKITAIHTPGHTPGMTCFDLGDGRVIVGDTIFVGGPGKTWSSDEFNRQMKTMKEIVFSWPDETKFFPGHGPSGVIGEERPDYETFVAQGWSPDLFGDVTWT
jgi:glyoxylase-like metal-dependent hydrolase (beta-lactamase superfamily II)